jgi:FixJ family two-component response regulator
MPTGRLLILDDEASVGLTLVFAAQACGFESRQCETVPAFMAALATWAPTHLAIDLTLPGTSGLEVLRQVADAGSQASVIVFSGAGAAELDAVLAEATQLGLATAGTLAKPFRLAALRQLLGTARGQA